MNRLARTFAAVRDNRLWQLLISLPVVAWFSHGLWHDSRAARLHVLWISQGREPLAGWLQFFGLISSMAFCTLIAVLLLVRRQPLASRRGLMPTAATLIGTFVLSGVLYLRPRPLTVGPLIGADALLLIGTTGMGIVLAYLGRSISLLPQARRLVTAGPYRLVRHPMYTCEMLNAGGLLILYWGGWMVLILLIFLGTQYVRTLYEEEILSETFSEYGAYRQRTWRFVPGLL